jgi:pilus assembly protein Flp/PilA
MIVLNDIKSKRREEGVTATEYALILALVAVAIIVVVQLLGGNISTMFNSASNAM